MTKHKRKCEGTRTGRRTSLALEGPQLLPDKSGRRTDLSGGLNSLRGAEDRRTFREALHFLPVKIEVGRVAFLPDVDATRPNLEPFCFVQTAGDEGEKAFGYGVEEDVGVPGGANANAGECWVLHQSLEGRAGRGRGKQGGRQRDGTARERGGFDGAGLYLWF